MAKNPKTVTPGLNLALLGVIVAATNAGSFHYVSQTDGQPLLDAGLIEINTGMVNDQKEAAARSTDKGNEMVNGGSNDTTTQAPASSGFALITNAEPPKVTRKGGGGGQKAKYPFEQMEIGNSFFVGNYQDKDGDAKGTLDATVANWNEKYKEPTGETKTVTRVVRGKDRKTVFNGDGSKQMETVTIPVKKSLRKFIARSVEAGKVYGGFTAPENGVLVSRVAVAVDADVD